MSENSISESCAIWETLRANRAIEFTSFFVAGNNARPAHLRAHLDITFSDIRNRCTKRDLLDNRARARARTHGRIFSPILSFREDNRVCNPERSSTFDYHS